MAARHEALCVYIGDFNSIFGQYEKKGSTNYPASLMRSFTDALLDSRLTEITLHGYQFTWERGRGTAQWVQEWLDRVFGSEGWLGRYTNCKLFNLTSSYSDHSPILLMTEDKQ